MIAHAQALLNCKESVNFWSSLLPVPTPLWALIGCEAGETGFDYTAVGDHDAAFGPFQHHLPRILFIRDHIGIDIRKARHLDQLKAAHWEMSEDLPANPYRHVWPALLEAGSEAAALTILIHNYEQSRNQIADFAKRMVLAEYWRAQVKGAVI